MPKADESYTPAPAMVCLDKPAQAREGPITQRRVVVTMKLVVVERMLVYAPQGKAGE